MRKRLGTPAIRIIRTQPRGSQEIEKRGNDDRDDHVRVISPFFNSLLTSAQAWVDNLNTLVNADDTIGYGGYTDWTLPTGDGSDTTLAGNCGPDGFTASGQGCGTPTSKAANQLGHLFITELGNLPGGSGNNNPYTPHFVPFTSLSYGAGYWSSSPCVSTGVIGTPCPVSNWFFATALHVSNIAMTKHFGRGSSARSNLRATHRKPNHYRHPGRQQLVCNFGKNYVAGHRQCRTRYQRLRCRNCARHDGHHVHLLGYKLFGQRERFSCYQEGHG